MANYISTVVSGLSQGLSVALYADYMRGSALGSDISGMLIIGAAYVAGAYLIDTYLNAQASKSSLAPAVGQLFYFGFAPVAAYYVYGISGAVPLAGAFLVGSIVAPMIASQLMTVVAVLSPDVSSM